MPLLVLITGTGRSGTSTMSGTLHHLGLSVPGPYLGANKSNPKGFFESKWSVRFHKQITAAARINDFDGRPGALDRARAAITPELRGELRAFLAEHAVEEQLVVKDPRTVWAQALWREAAAEAGRDLVFISMLRHPAEVVGSRSTYYAAQSEDLAARRRYETFNVARWVNNSLISERGTRGMPRAFVRYTDLLEDWRPVLQRLGEELGLRYNVDPASGEPSPVDEFIDPRLRRHAVTWADLEVPAPLQDIAERVWQDVCVLGEKRGVDDGVSADLDELSAAYAILFSQSAAIAHDVIEQARMEGAAQARAELETEVASLREKLARARRKRRSPSGPLVERTGSKDLLKVVGRRAVAKASGRLGR